jgi:hypothetical protein
MAIILIENHEKCREKQAFFPKNDVVGVSYGVYYVVFDISS